MGLEATVTNNESLIEMSIEKLLTKLLKSAGIFARWSRDQLPMCSASCSLICGVPR